LEAIDAAYMQGSENVLKCGGQKNISIGRREVDEYLLSSWCGSRFLSRREVYFFLLSQCPSETAERDT
jgi:hypothetical protein